MTEIYYAIRIGDFIKDSPYLMLSQDDKTPMLFATRKEADEALQTRRGERRSVVRVEIKFRN